MDSAKRQQISQYLDTTLLFVWGITFLLFPLFFSTLTTEGIILPKQLLVCGVVLLCALLWGAKMLFIGKVGIRRTPFDVSILLFTGAILLSSLFAVDRANSLIAFSGTFFALMSYFLILNSAKLPNAFSFLTTSLLAGGALADLVSIANHYKLYLLPFSATHSTLFTPFGNYADQAIYSLVLFLIAAGISIPLLRKNETTKAAPFVILGGIVTAGLLASVYLYTKQQNLLLPFQIGFQTAFAAISQDTGRIAQGFFFGSGYGNFLDVFTRFKPVSFNANPTLWFQNFSSSSSFVLELLATTGIIGLLSYLFFLSRIVLYKARLRNPIFAGILLIALISFVFPLSFSLLTLFIFALALFSLYQQTHDAHHFYEVEFQFVTLKKGIFSFSAYDEEKKTRNNATPIFAFVLLLALTVFLGFYAATYAYSDLLFQQGFTAANSNNGTAAYRYEAQALSTFRYRSDFYRVFSQTNIALANSLLALNSSKGSSPSNQVQQTAYTLVQQAITSARSATDLAPQNVVGWQNLASVYRSLIGVGQGAENFAIAATQQAVQLDPANPQEFLALGGIYYQLGQYDNAIKVFQQATTLKQDYPNAYYNLGHAYEQKQDYQNALAAYQIVKQLVAADKTNTEKITAEINAVQAKSGQQATQNTTPSKIPSGASAAQPLSLPQTAPSVPQEKQILLPSPTPSK